MMLLVSVAIGGVLFSATPFTLSWAVPVDSRMERLSLMFLDVSGLDFFCTLLTIDNRWIHSGDHYSSPGYSAHLRHFQHLVTKRLSCGLPVNACQR